MQDGLQTDMQREAQELPLQLLTKLNLLNQPRFELLTFQKSIRSDGEKRSLKQSLAENERLVPLWGIQHHRVFELLCIPPQKIFQLMGKLV